MSSPKFLLYFLTLDKNLWYLDHSSSIEELLPGSLLVFLSLSSGFRLEPESLVLCSGEQGSEPAQLRVQVLDGQLLKVGYQKRSIKIYFSIIVLFWNLIYLHLLHILNSKVSVHCSIENYSFQYLCTMEYDSEYSSIVHCVQIHSVIWSVYILY